MPDLEVIETFAQRLQADGAEVLRCTPDTLSQTVVGLIASRCWDRVVSVRRDRVGHPSVLGDDPELSDEQLRQMDAVITESAGGIAEPAVVVLDHRPGQGRPGVPTTPDTHVCVVRADAVVGTLADIDHDGATTRTFVAGPNSAAIDEIDVHRPVTAIVVLVV